MEHTFFSGIKQCYLLINNIDKVPNLDQSSKDDYIAQVDFFDCLLSFLAFTLLWPDNIGKRGTCNKYFSQGFFLGRTPYDECVDWIAERFDDVALRLPANRSNRLMGLATSVAAKAIKSRMLLYAASPLYNGNSMYADFKIPMGLH